MTPGRGPTLAERTAAARLAQIPESVRSRHCWVIDPPQRPGTWPGIVLEWNRGTDGWHGRVAYLVQLDDQAALVIAELPAEALRPLEG